MDGSKLKDEMSRAKALFEANPDFWDEYMRGLRRAYYGEKFGTDEERRDALRRSRLKGKLKIIIPASGRGNKREEKNHA